MTLIESAEQAKYTRLWSDVHDYREHSPGLENVQRFIDVINPGDGATLIDLGCGTGAAGLAFKQRDLNVSWLDITSAGLLADIPRDKFIESSLWSDWANYTEADYGFCCDVMEHLPPEFTMLAVDRILSACRTAWFQIAFVKDGFGSAIGKPLHLTVQPFVWWRDRLRSLGNLTIARDLCGCGLFVVDR